MRDGLKVVAVVVGVFVATIGLVIAVLIGALSIVTGVPYSDNLPFFTMTVSMLVISLGFGTLLAATGWSSLRGYPRQDFSLPGWGWWLAIWIAVLILRQLLASRGWVILSPLWHILATVLPVLLCLAFVSGSAGYWYGANRRRVLGAMGWGALGGLGIAAFLELLIVAVILAVTAGWVLQFAPRLASQMSAIVSRLAVDTDAKMVSDLARLVRQPGILGGTFLILAGLVPLIEETSKSVGVLLVSFGQRPYHAIDAFMYGTATGAGFGLVEGMFNLMLISSPAQGWAFSMLLRGGTVALHAFASGLAGWGWYAILIDRRSKRGALLIFLAMALHGIWNILAIGIGLGSILTSPYGQGITTAAYGGLLVMWAITVTGLWIVSHRLGQAALGTGRLPMPSWEKVIGAEAIEPGVDGASSEALHP